MSNHIVEISESFMSEKKSIQYVEPMIGKVKEKIPLELEKYYNILIAVTEAFNNAIIHGNKCDIDKKVKIKIIADETLIKVSIFDEGEGFDPDQVADPREPENLFKDSGRGVFLIKELTDECVFSPSPKGTTVNMVFRVK